MLRRGKSGNELQGVLPVTSKKRSLYEKEKKETREGKDKKISIKGVEY